jgi:serine/threonine-protein kinase
LTVVERDSQVSGKLGSGPGDGTRGDLAVGAAAGDYVVTELIARGGCGSVYRARHRELDRSAAVKVLHGPLALLPKMVQRFAREVRVVGMLRHPNIVEIYDIGHLPDHRPYYAMEYLSGRTLSTILEEQGRMSPLEVLEVLDPVCAALAAAHAAGVIHRDVKASNIMVDGATGLVKLLDFGIAKLVGPQAGPHGLTSEGRQVGTLTIMAPEQLMGGPVDARIDVYALGVLLFRLLTGRLPFDGKNAITLAQQHLEEPAPRPSARSPVAPSFDAIVLRCLEKRPERRYATVEDFLDALRRAARTSRPRWATPIPGSVAVPRAAMPLGVGVYVDIRLRADTDEAVADAGVINDLAEEALRDGGFVLAALTSSAVLGVRPLPDDPSSRLAVRGDALEIAALLHEQVIAREGRDPRVHANVCVHVDGLAWQDGGLAGGALVHTEHWAPFGDVHALCATRAAAEGISGFDLGPVGDPLEIDDTLVGLHHADGAEPDPRPAAVTMGETPKPPAQPAKPARPPRAALVSVTRRR